MSTLIKDSETILVPVTTRLTLDERDRLRARLFRKGFTSLSSWFRQQAIQELSKPEPVCAAVGTKHEASVAAAE